MPSNLAESEANNTKAQADALDLNANGRTQLSGLSRNHDDKDYFDFITDRIGSLQLTVTSTRGSTAQLEVETPAGVNVFETEPNNGVNSGSLGVLAGRKYFVRLPALGTSAAGYEVNLRFV